MSVLFSYTRTDTTPCSPGSGRSTVCLCKLLNPRTVLIGSLFVGLNKLFETLSFIVLCNSDFQASTKNIHKMWAQMKRVQRFL